MTPSELLAEALMGNTPDEPVSLAELLERPAWMSDGLCQEHPEVSFFPDLGEQATAAKAVCSACLCRRECLAYALDTGEAHGVRGGESPAGRQALRKPHRAA